MDEGRVIQPTCREKTETATYHTLPNRLTAPLKIVSLYSADIEWTVVLHGFDEATRKATFYRSCHGANYGTRTQALRVGHAMILNENSRVVSTTLLPVSLIQHHWTYIPGRSSYYCTPIFLAGQWISKSQTWISSGREVMQVSKGENSLAMHISPHIVRQLGLQISAV